MPDQTKVQGEGSKTNAVSSTAEPAPRAEVAGYQRSGVEARVATERMLGGLERIREILLGDILGELERRLGRIDNQLANRTSELQQDARHRTDVIEAHVRKEVEALAGRATKDNRDVNEAIRKLAHEHRNAVAEIEQRLERIEDRVEASITRIERETRQQLLDQAKSFLTEIERARQQLRVSLVRELGLEPSSLEEGSEHDAGAWANPH